MNAHASKIKPPKLYNSHLQVTHPYAPIQSPNSILQTQIKQKSLQYQLAYQKLNEPSPPSQDYLSDIPLPKVLTRHIEEPSTNLLEQSALGKITGYRIEVTGRRGTRSSKNVINYGKLDTASSGKSYVDFGKAVWVNKKGVTGVKVWVGYSH